MTAPTGDELLDILNSFEEPTLDYYVSIRRRFELDHDRTKLFIGAKYVTMEALQKGVDLGITFDQMADVVNQGLLLPNVLYIIDKVGSPLDEAIAAQEAYLPIKQLRGYVGLRTQRNMSHEETLSTIRDARAASVPPDDIVSLVLYGIGAKEAIEAVTAGIFYLDYAKQFQREHSHQEIMAEATRYRR